MRAIEHENYNFYNNLESSQSELISFSGYPEKYYTLLALKGLISLYFGALSKKKVIESIDWEKADSSFIKAVLNDRDMSNKRDALNKANSLISLYEDKLFKKLDNQANPYYVLLCPIYKYKNLFPSDSSGWVKAPSSGVRELSLIACENYFKYTVNKVL